MLTKYFRKKKRTRDKVELMSVRAKSKRSDWSYEKKMWNLQKQLQDCLETEPHEGRSKPIYSFRGIQGAEREQPLFNFPNNNRKESTVGGLTTLALLRSNPLLGHSFQDYDEDEENPMTISDDSDIESLCQSTNTPHFDLKRHETYFL